MPRLAMPCMRACMHACAAPPNPLKLGRHSLVRARLHAQVAQFLSPRELDAGTIRRAVNSMLPPDVRVREAARAPLAFNCRYSLGKTYRACTCCWDGGRKRIGVMKGAVGDAG